MVKLTVFMIWSTMAVIIPAAAHAQASFIFSNYNKNFGLDAPVTNSAGERLAGTNYLAMLYGGLSSNSLVALPPALSFSTGDHAGYFGTAPTNIRYIPDVAGGANVWVQVKVWDARLGLNYEEAKSRNIGGYGESDLLYLRSGGCHQCLHEFLTGLKSFGLRPYSGLFALISLSTDNTVKLQWIGNAAKVQIQEKSSVDDAWRDIGDAVTNSIRIIATNRVQFFRILNSP